MPLGAGSLYDCLGQPARPDFADSTRSALLPGRRDSMTNRELPDIAIQERIGQCVLIVTRNQWRRARLDYAMTVLLRAHDQFSLEQAACVACRGLLVGAVLAVVDQCDREDMLTASDSPTNVQRNSIIDDVLSIRADEGVGLGR